MNLTVNVNSGSFYNASTRTYNQIYMLIIILLILSQDSSLNTSIKVAKFFFSH